MATVGTARAATTVIKHRDGRPNEQLKTELTKEGAPHVGFLGGGTVIAIKTPLTSVMLPLDLIERIEIFDTLKEGVDLVI